MNRYLSEVSRKISGNGVTVTPDEDAGVIKVLHHNSPLCVIGADGIRYNKDHINTEQKEELLHEIRNQVPNIAEYIKAFENAPPLAAEGLEEGYCLIAEHNRVVLAGKDMGKYGYQFVTWGRTYGDTGLTHGHYMNDNYPAAKEDFVVRSGLVDSNRMFNEEQLKRVYCALDYYRWQNPDITDKQDTECKDIMEKIEHTVPDADSALHEEQSSEMNIDL